MTTGLACALALAAAGFVVAIGFLIKDARGGCRVLAILGTLLIFLGLLGRFARQVIIERYLGTVDNELIVTVLAVEIAAAGVVTVAGLLLVTGALVSVSNGPKVDRRASR